jgi:hypothetical protein
VGRVRRGDSLCYFLFFWGTFVLIEVFTCQCVNGVTRRAKTRIKGRCLLRSGIKSELFEFYHKRFKP